MRNRNTKREIVQLRGISRSPSDRATTDGGVAESINMHIMEGESVPALPPVDITDDPDINSLIPENYKGEIVYIHKTASYTNYIGLDDGHIVSFVGQEEDDDPEHTHPDVTPPDTDLPDIEDPDNGREPSENLPNDREPAENLPSPQALWDDETPTLNAEFTGIIKPREDGIVIGQLQPAGTHNGLFLGQIIKDDSTNKLYDVIAKDGDNYVLGEFPSVKERLPVVPDIHQGVHKIFSLDGEQLKDIKSIGNTLIVMTENNMHYALFREGQYYYLGTEIPKPHIDFIQQEVYKLSQYEYENIPEKYAGEDPQMLALADNVDDEKAVFGQVLKNEDAEDDRSWSKENSAYGIQIYEGKRWQTADYKAIDKMAEKLLDKIWECVSSIRDVNHRSGILNEPIFITYALRLYDGSSYAPSVPIPLGMAFYDMDKEERSNYFDINVNSVFFTVAPGAGNLTGVSFLAKVHAWLAYIVRMSFEDLYEKYANWKDIVTGLDIYVSEPCSLEKTRDTCKVLKSVKRADNDNRLKYYIDNGLLPLITSDEGYSFNVVLDPENAFDKREQNTMDKVGPFFLVKSYDFEEFDRISGTREYLKADFTTESLSLYSTLTNEFVNPTLANEFMSNHRISASGAMAYNESLYAFDIRQQLTAGYGGISGAFHQGMTSSQRYEYQLTYHINTSDGQSLDVKSPIIKETWYSHGAIFYPDPRCRTAVVAIRPMDSESAWEYHRIEFKECPNISASYFYAGMGRSLSTAFMESVKVASAPAENNVEIIQGKVFKSASANPFFYPETSRVTIAGGKIIGLATSTQAISTGQFGEYPLYAFAEDGIWALSISVTGDIISSKPLSREKALSRETITPIDHAVVFATEKGVMLLSGSDTTNISPDMNGRHFCIDEISAEGKLLEPVLPDTFMEAIHDDTTFMNFISKAVCTPDYTGSRLIFFRPDMPYQYIYKLDTQTWHKYTEDTDGSAMTLTNRLNSYPDCYIAVKKGNRTRLMNFSTPLDVTRDDTLNGIVITRSMDFNNPDILKKITSIKVRGQYAKGSVKYILLGSQDGQRFHVIHSLNGKSWKVFRMVIVARLKPTESITYIDIEYENKFDNRMR